MQRALVLGELCLDAIIYNPTSVPVLGEPVWAEGAGVRMGGSASYVAQGLKALEAEVYLSGVLGDDFIAQHGLETLQQAGIDISMVRRLPDQASPLCIAISEREAKSFVGCSPLLPYNQDDLKLPEEDVELIYFGGYLLYPELWDGSLARFFARAKGHALIALDTQMLPISPQLYKDEALQAKNLEHVDILLTARKEALALTSCTRPMEAARALGDLGPRIVVIKLGKDGSLTYTAEGSYVSKSFHVHARDLIGAGDFFGAAFTYSVLQDWDLPQASDFANAFAALCVRRTSAQSIPDRSQVLAFMEIEGRAVPGSWR